MPLRLLLSLLLLVGLTACGDDSLTPVIIEGENSAPPTSSPPPVQQTGVSSVPGAVTDKEALPTTGSRGRGFIKILGMRDKSGSGRTCKLSGLAYRWGPEKRGAHERLFITTRPQGTNNWPWLTMESWIHAPQGLAAWKDHRTIINKASFQLLPDRSPWQQMGDGFFTITAVAEEKITLEIEFVFRDPVDGEKKQVTGTFVAVAAR